jgi:hypothetical protein
MNLLNVAKSVADRVEAEALHAEVRYHVATATTAMFVV